MKTRNQTKLEIKNMKEEVNYKIANEEAKMVNENHLWKAAWESPKTEVQLECPWEVGQERR